MLDQNQPPSSGVGDVNPLARRMIELDLDLYELSLSDAALARHLQRRCSLCAKRTYCIEDITYHCRVAGARVSREWLSYCPNSATLEMLVTLKRQQLVERKYSFPYFG